MLPKFDYVRASSQSQAINLCRSTGNAYHAGGTDLLGCLRDGVASPHQVVSIGGLEELRGIDERSDGGIRIGPLTTLAEIADHPLIVERYTALAEAAASVASPQLRNQGTLGGNLCQRPRCWYFRGDFDCLRRGGSFCSAMADGNQNHAILGGYGCYMVHPSDTAPALVSLDATVRIASAEGTFVRPIDSFFVSPREDVRRETILQPGDILTDVLLPRVEDGLRSIYRKVRSRGSWDFALAGVAAALRSPQASVEHARIVLSGVSPVPWRAAAAEAELLGKGLTTDAISNVAEASVVGAHPLSRNGYKVDLVRGLVAETLGALALQRNAGNNVEKQ